MPHYICDKWSPVLTRCKGLGAVRGLQSHLEVGGHTRTSWHRVDDGRHIAGGQSTRRQCLAAHVNALLSRKEGRLARCPEAAKHGNAASGGHEHWQGATLGSHCDQTSTISRGCCLKTLRGLSKSPERASASVASRNTLPQEFSLSTQWGFSRTSLCRRAATLHTFFLPPRLRVCQRLA